jgi:purine-cytosine permease-like protein
MQLHHGLVSVIVGVTICSFISLVVVILGIDVFQVYERYAFAPQLPVLFVLIGIAGTKANILDWTIRETGWGWH